MPAVYLVRHGQASFGTDDYDVLSPLGREQAGRAGDVLARRGLGSPVVVSGSLTRQQDTARIVAARLGAAVAVDARFDEFDAHAAVDGALGGPGSSSALSSAQFQVVLDDVLRGWMTSGDPGWTAFVEGAWSALTGVVAALPSGRSAIVVTSAGVTAALAGRALGCGADGVIAMNRVSVNASITTMVHGARGWSLVTFNEHGHLLGEPGLRTNR